jgi:hypothetical protein
MSNRFFQPTRLMLAFFFAIPFSYGCTGLKSEVRPDPESVNLTISKECPQAILWDLQPFSQCPTCPYIARDFAKTLKNTSIFSGVTYVTAKPKMEKDLLLKATFKGTHDENKGGNNGKAMTTGLFLLLPAPFTWYEEYYNLTGLIEVDTPQGQSREFRAQATGVTKFQMLSEGEKGSPRVEAMSKARTSLFRQLAQQLAQFCEER